MFLSVWLIKHFPIWCNVKFLLCFFILFNAVKTVTKLKLHHMGNLLLFNLPRYNLKSGGLHFIIFFFTIKNIWDRLPFVLFYHVRTEMRQHLILRFFSFSDQSRNWDNLSVCNPGLLNEYVLQNIQLFFRLKINYTVRQRRYKEPPDYFQTLGTEINFSFQAFY